MSHLSSHFMSINTFKGTIGNSRLLTIKRGNAATNTPKPRQCERADVETPNVDSWKQQQRHNKVMYNIRKEAWIFGQQRIFLYVLQLHCLRETIILVI